MGDSTAFLSSAPWFAPFIMPTVTIAVALYALHYYQTQSRTAKLANQIPGPATIPLIGNAHEVIGITDNAVIFERAYQYKRDFGNVIRAWVGPKLVIFLSDPRDAEVILNSQTHIEKSEEYRFFEPWLGDGLLISTGEKWRAHRKLIAPTFHMNVLKTFVDLFNENSMGAVDRLKKEIGKEFDVHDYMSETTVDILLETAMGSKKTSACQKGFEYAMAVMKMCDILHQRQLKFWYRPDILFGFSSLKKLQNGLLETIHGLTRSVIKSKKEVFDENVKKGKLPKPTLQEIISNEREVAKAVQSARAAAMKTTGLRDDLDDIDENDVGEKRRLAFLDLMIETAHYTRQLTDEEIKDQVNTIMFEGHDTTAAGSSFVLCMLGTHPDIQKKVMEEQRQIFGDSKRPVTFNDTLEMKYLERVIMETLRMYPPVPIIARKVNEDVRLVSGDYTIPANTTVVIGIFTIHRDPNNYENPDTFDPDNFLSQKTQNRNYYSFIPFSAGPRSCVGRKYAMLKLKILLSNIVRNYRIISKVEEKDFILQGDIILKRADGFRIVIEPR